MVWLWGRRLRERWSQHCLICVKTTDWRFSRSPFSEWGNCEIYFKCPFKMATFYNWRHKLMEVPFKQHQVVLGSTRLWRATTASKRKAFISWLFSAGHHCYGRSLRTDGAVSHLRSSCALGWFPVPDPIPALYDLVPLDPCLALVSVPPFASIASTLDCYHLQLGSATLSCFRTTVSWTSYG